LVKTVTIEQVVDDTNAIASFNLTGTTSTKGGYTIVHTKPGGSMFFPGARKTIWLKGVSTTNYADGSVMKLNTVCTITGTKSYTTALGSQKTLFVVEPVE
jgi:hypothetical protein